MIANVSIACVLAQALSEGASDLDLKNILYILFIVGFGLLSWIGKWIKGRQEGGTKDKKKQPTPEPPRIDLREVVQSLARPPVAKPARPAAHPAPPPAVPARARPPKPPTARPPRDRRPAVPSLAAMRPARRANPDAKPITPVQGRPTQVAASPRQVPSAKGEASASMALGAEHVTPAALRKAIVLAEILGPPVAMRAVPGYAREA